MTVQETDLLALVSHYEAEAHTPVGYSHCLARVWEVGFDGGRRLLLDRLCCSGRWVALRTARRTAKRYAKCLAEHGHPTRERIAP